jgi:multimeric flavodoxin WrbA
LVLLHIVGPERLSLPQWWYPTRMSSNDRPLRALALVCTLTPSPAASSSELLARQLLDQLRERGVAGELIRVVDHDVRAGVQLDMGDGDAWPAIREQLVAADILVLATPTWMGQPSSVAQRVLERLDAELSETDDQGRLTTYGKVAVAAVVGNEDGAHHISAILFQGLNDVGFSLAANAVTYWNDEVHGQYRDYQDLPETPAGVASTTAKVAANAAHLARLLSAAEYPPT